MAKKLIGGSMMRMSSDRLNWDDLKFVLALHRHKTMTNAATSLNTNVATVSRRLERISDVIGQPLFRKRSHHWEPTTFTESLVSVASTTQLGIEALAVSSSVDQDDHAELRISAAMQVYQGWILKNTTELLEEHPNLTVTFQLENRSVALGEADISVSHAPPTSGRLILKRVDTIELCAFRSTAHDRPPRGWMEINYAQQRAPIKDAMYQVFRRPHRASMDGLNLASALMAEANLVAYLPCDFVQKKGGFELLDANMPTFKLDIWLTYHESRKNDPLIKLGTEFIDRCFHSKTDAFDTFEPS